MKVKIERQPDGTHTVKADERWIMGLTERQARDAREAIDAAAHEAAESVRRTMRAALGIV